MCEDNRIIQSLWVGPRLSTMERLSIRSFLANGHEFHLYCYAPIAGIPEGAIVKDAREIVPESDVEKFRNLANFSDSFRYNLLLKKGGWWSDTDSVCLRPLDFNQNYVFSSEVVRFGADLKGHTNCGNIKVPPAAKLCDGAASKYRKRILAQTLGLKSVPFC